MNRKIKTLIMITALMCSYQISSAAKLFFSGANTLIKNCPSTISIMIDTEGEEVNSAGVNILLDKDSYIINEIDPSVGVFRSYPVPKELEARIGKFANQKYIRQIGSTSSPNGFKGVGVFSNITITPKKDFSIKFYMIPGYDGEDSNLAVIDENGSAQDALSEAKEKVFYVKTGECTLNKLEPIDLTTMQPTINVEDIEEIAATSIQINKENVFDSSQKFNFIKENRMYILIGLIIIILIILLTKKKNK